MIVREAQGRADLLLQKAQARLEEIERDINELRLRRRGVEGIARVVDPGALPRARFIREQDKPRRQGPPPPSALRRCARASARGRGRAASRGRARRRPGPLRADPACARERGNRICGSGDPAGRTDRGRGHPGGRPARAPRRRAGGRRRQRRADWIAGHRLRQAEARHHARVRPQFARQASRRRRFDGEPSSAHASMRCLFLERQLIPGRQSPVPAPAAPPYRRGAAAVRSSAFASTSNSHL